VALRILHLMSVGTVAALMTASSHATLYLSTAAWEAAFGGPTEEIGFHEPGVAMRIEEYYADRGVHFLAGGSGSLGQCACQDILSGLDLGVVSAPER